MGGREGGGEVCTTVTVTVYVCILVPDMTSTLFVALWSLKNVLQACGDIAVVFGIHSVCVVEARLRKCLLQLHQVQLQCSLEPTVWRPTHTVAIDHVRGKRN